MKVLKVGIEGLSYKPYSKITCAKVGIGEIKQYHNLLRVQKIGSNIPHTASGETSVRALRADAERANSVGICLAN